jgi:hypothetical protein
MCRSAKWRRRIGMLGVQERVKGIIITLRRFSGNAGKED